MTANLQGIEHNSAVDKSCLSASGILKLHLNKSGFIETQQTSKCNVYLTKLPKYMIDYSHIYKTFKTLVCIFEIVNA